ncbi:hypothetical protein [Escherichia phage BF17]|nr:hypothetical protein [Escherichia phage BF17]
MYDDLDLAFERMVILMQCAEMHETIRRTKGIEYTSKLFSYESRRGMDHFYCTDCSKFSVLKYYHPTVSNNSLISTYDGVLFSVMYDTLHPSISIYKDCDSSLSYIIEDYLSPNTEENIFQNSVLHDELSIKCIYMFNKLKEYADNNYLIDKLAVLSVSVFNTNDIDMKYYNEICKVHHMYKELLCQ